MGKGEDRTVGETLAKSRLLPEVVGHEHCLAMSRHQRMDCPEQDSCRHNSEDRSEISARDLAKAASHTAIKPMLDINDAVHVRRRVSSLP